MHAIIVFSPLAIIAFVIALITALIVAQTIFVVTLAAITRRAAAGATGTTLILLSIAGGCKERGKYNGEDLHFSLLCGLKVPLLCCTENMTGLSEACGGGGKHIAVKFKCRLRRYDDCEKKLACACNLSSKGWKGHW